MAYKPYRGFSWAISSYYPLSLQESHSEKELRKEYARLRAVAQKSLKRMGESEFAEGETYRSNVGRFTATSKLKSKRDVARALTDVTRFLSAKSHSISGLKEIRAEAVATWQAGGYEWVTTQNYNDWVRFLSWYKELKGVVYDLNAAVRQYKNASREELDAIRNSAKENFEYYIQNLDER